FRTALVIDQKLAEDNPKMPSYCDGLADGHTNLADVLRGLGRPAEARDGYERAVAIRQRLVNDQPSLATYRSSLAPSLRRRGLARSALGDPAGAAADARHALELYEGLPSRSGAEWYETACCRAALVGLAGVAGSGLSVAARESEADAAMDLFRK